MWGLAALLVLAGAAGPAPAAAQAVSGDVARGGEAARVDSLFADMDDTRSPGCAGGVRRDGRTLLARGYGMADLEHGVPITASTVFRSGSVSKQITAASVLLLARDGSLSLDDPVRRWVPELPERDPPVTVRHLLHHTSGIRDYLELMTLAGRRDRDYDDDEDVLAMLARQRQPNFPAGSDHLYSNSGYFLLGQVVRAASGRSLRAFARERIFEPLGMDASHFHDDPDHVVPRRATGYAPRDEGGWRISVTTLPMVGDGGVFTSVEDFLRWLANFERPEVGGPGFPEAMAERGVLSGGDTLDYAMGIVVDQRRGLAWTGHGGAFVGYRAGMVRYPDQGLSAVALCNRSDADPMGRLAQLAEIYLGDVMEPAAAGTLEPAGADGDEGELADDEADAGPAVAPADLRAYSGRYESPELGVVYRIELEGSALRLRVGNRLDGDLEPAGEGVLERRFLELRFDEPVDGRSPGFVLDAGRVRGLRFERVPGGS